MDQYLADSWTLDNTLGVAGYGDHLARLAAEAPLPFTLAVTGGGGSGKTSILRRAFATLGGRSLNQPIPLSSDVEEWDPGSWLKYYYESSGREEELLWSDRTKATAAQSICVWFSPWQHLGVRDMFLCMLREIRSQFASKIIEVNQIANPNAPSQLGALGGMTALERAIVLAEKLGVCTDTPEEAHSPISYDPNQSHLAVSDGQRFRLYFEHTISLLIKDLASKLNFFGVEGGDQVLPDSRLIVFIDDLDRCPPEVVNDLLLGIQLYASCRRCCFVFAFDEDSVLSVFTGRRPEWTETEGRQDLRKFFQALLPVPEADPKKIYSFAKGVLDAHDFPRASDCAREFTSFLEPNPRIVKTFLNSLCLA
ncbi:MAG: P-loop NTPase fold protein, partial [Planctomycetota bacterium]